MYLYTYLDENFIVEIYFPVHQKGTYLHNVVILITLVNESEREHISFYKNYLKWTLHNIMCRLAGLGGLKMGVLIFKKSFMFLKGGHGNASTR